MQHSCDVILHAIGDVGLYTTRAVYECEPVIYYLNIQISKHLNQPHSSKFGGRVGLKSTPGVFIAP